MTNYEKTKKPIENSSYAERRTRKKFYVGNNLIVNNKYRKRKIR